MFAFLAAIAFGIATFRDFFTTAPAHQLGWLFLGLTFLALHWAFAIAIPAFAARTTKEPS